VNEKQNEWLNDIEAMKNKQMKLSQIIVGLIAIQEF
jgi:hypothetical protein